jgi:hypothetical protein
MAVSAMARLGTIYPGISNVAYCSGVLLGVISTDGRGNL